MFNLLSFACMLKDVAGACEVDDASSSVCDPRINDRLKAQVRKVYDVPQPRAFV